MKESIYSNSFSNERRPSRWSSRMNPSNTTGQLSKTSTLRRWYRLRGGSRSYREWLQHREQSVCPLWNTSTTTETLSLRTRKTTLAIQEMISLCSNQRAKTREIPQWIKSSKTPPQCHHNATIQSTIRSTQVVVSVTIRVPWRPSKLTMNSEPQWKKTSLILILRLEARPCYHLTWAPRTWDC